MKKGFELKLDGIEVRVIEEHETHLIVRSMYMDFEISKSELREILSSPNAGEKWMVFTRPARERQKFIKELKTILQGLPINSPKPTEETPWRDSMVYGVV